MPVEVNNQPQIVQALPERAALQLIQHGGLTRRHEHPHRKCNSELAQISMAPPRQAMMQLHEGRVRRKCSQGRYPLRIAQFLHHGSCRDRH
ncbi:hypothetical protein D9M68_643040 [compost metagenome]